MYSYGRAGGILSKLDVLADRVWSGMGWDKVVPPCFFVIAVVDNGVCFHWGLGGIG